MFLRYLYVNDQQLYIYKYHLPTIVRCVYMNEEFILMDIIGVYLIPYERTCHELYTKSASYGSPMDTCWMLWKWFQSRTLYIGNDPKVIPLLVHW